MDILPPKPRKQRNMTKEELLKLDKDELVHKIIQLEAHNGQLKNIISKNLSKDEVGVKKKKRQFDFSNSNSRRVLLHVLYLGWDYQGLAVQEDTISTIEHHLFHALTKSCLIESREKSQYHRSGRTDKGVSAFGQVISISLRSNLKDDEDLSKEIPYCKMLNRLLPRHIRVVAWMPIPDDKPDYSARFNCTKRQYKYYFPRASLDVACMRDACARLVGSHDFRHFCKMDVGNGVTQFVRNIIRAEILPVENEGDSPYTMYYLLIEGNAFLWHQIRCIMGILLLVGQCKEAPGVVSELLDVETRPRGHNVLPPDRRQLLVGQRKEAPDYDKVSGSGQAFLSVRFLNSPQYNMALDVPLNLFRCSYELEQTQKWVYDIEELRVVISQLQSEWTVHNVKSTMIKDFLQELEKEYEKLSERDETSKSNELEGDKITCHADCLLQGVKPRVYQPLMKRVTCSSLEERIEYYAKKRKGCDES